MVSCHGMSEIQMFFMHNDTSTSARIASLLTGVLDELLQPSIRRFRVEGLEKAKAVLRRSPERAYSGSH